MRRRAGLLVVLGLTLAACATPRPEVVPPVIPPPRAERPTYALGDRWIRDDGVYELIRIDDDRYVFVDTRGREIHLGKDLVPAAWGRRYVEWDFRAFGKYGPPEISWPLAVGQSGTSKGMWEFFEWQTAPPQMHPGVPQSSRPREYAATRTPATFQWTVETYEPVRVAAGSFDAFRILFTLTPMGETAPRWSLRVWYAPAVRQWVRAEGRNAGLFGFQLVAVDRPEAGPPRVALVGPDDQSRVATGDLVLRGTIASGQGIAGIGVTLNGEDVPMPDVTGTPREVPLRVPIRLREGRNLLLVTARNTAGETGQEARTVFYDPRTARAAAGAARDRMDAARQVAAQLDAEHRAPAAWTAAGSSAADAEAALADQAWERAEAGFDEARKGYETAAREAEVRAAFAARQAETRGHQERVVEARRAAEVAQASRLATGPWARATGAQQEAEAALARQEIDRAQALFRNAERLYREAERDAIQQAAAAERTRLAALKRQLDAAEQVASAAATARRAAEQAGAARHAADRLATAQALERAGQAALDRQDYPTAEQRFREAQQGYQAATRAGADEAARLAALERERAQTGELRAQVAQASAAAEEAQAARFAPRILAAARTAERDAVAAASRHEHGRARQLFADARGAYEQAAQQAQRAALPPLLIALASPGDQARVEQDTIALAAVVSSGLGVSRVLLTLNGAELRRMEEPAPRRSIAIDQAIRLRDGQNTLVLTATEADGSLHQEVRTVHYERRVPLTLSVRYPEDRARVTEDATVLAAVVTSSQGVARVTVSLNGTEVYQERERTAQRSVALAVPLILKPGPNAIVLTASEPDGTTRQELRTVVYEQPRAAPPVPAAAAARPAERWAVVVGVGRYDHPDIPRLRYASRDAEALYEILTGSGGFKKEHVLLLTDTTDKKPTLRQIKWALGTFLARSARKDDTVLIFFAGHGAPEPDPRGLERDGLSKYLVPADAEPDDLYSTGLPMDELQTIFDRIEAERVVAFLDTCYSGAAGGRTFAARRTRGATVDDVFLERLTRAKGRAIITASRPAEVSMELPELGHGLFTYYLLQGLRGAADLDRDGIVSLQELYQYVEGEVSQRSRAAGGNQHPVMKGELEGVLPLVRVAR